MKRITLGALFLLVLTSLTLQPATAKTVSLDGRLGGAKTTFEKRFGKNTGQDEKLHGLDYTVQGYGVVAVAFDKVQAIGVTVIADRTAHTPLSDADPADWDSAAVARVVKDFLPKDVKLDNAP